MQSIEPTVTVMHADALRVLGGHVTHLRGTPGATVLLRSSQPGMGKSHLLSRLVASCDGGFFVPLDVNRDSRPSWVGLLRGILHDCSQSSAPRSKLSFLDQLSRRLMGEAAAELILRGDVPTADPAGAITMLKRDYLRAFDMSGGGSEVARWMVGNFNVLLPLMGEVLGSRAVIDPDEAVAWLRVLSRFNAGSVADRKAALASVVMLGEDEGAQLGAKQRLRSFCRLAAIDEPLVLVFDHLDALAGAAEDAMVLSCMIGEIGRLQFGVGVILSLNADVWESVFDGHLPAALADRLTGRVVELGGVNVSESEALLRLRLDGAGVAPEEAEEVLREARIGQVLATRWGGSAAPREVLRHAAAVWDRLANPGVAAPEAGSGTTGTGAEGSVTDYLPPTEHLPAGASLAEPETLRPISKVGRTGKGSGRGAPEPEKVDPGTIKQMGNISSLLRELKSRREQFVPGRQDGGNADVPSGSASDVSQVDDGASPLVQRFGALRDALLQKRGQRLDLEALRRMVSLAGESFPVVESSEFKMSPGEEPTVMKWAFPGNEILFGFEPEHQFRYWQSLIKLAARRAESGAAGRLKLVVFCDREEPFSGAASADEAELEAARDEYLDVIDLDTGMIASVAAADRVVFELAKADSPVLPADAIRELAPQLDPLWRRITRPLVGTSEEGEKAV